MGSSTLTCSLLSRQDAASATANAGASEGANLCSDAAFDAEVAPGLGLAG